MQTDKERQHANSHGLLGLTGAVVTDDRRKISGVFFCFMFQMAKKCGMEGVRARVTDTGAFHCHQRWHRCRNPLRLVRVLY